MSARHRRTVAARPKAHERILSFLEANLETAVTAATVAVLTGCSTTQARHRLEALVRRGGAIRVGDGDRYRAASTSEETGEVDHVR